MTEFFANSDGTAWRWSLLGVFLLLAACGFEPLLGDGPRGPTAVDLADIRVLPIANRSGQTLRNNLTDDLSSRDGPNASRYTLAVSLYEPRQEIAIRRDELASRVAYTATASFVLRDSKGAALFNGFALSGSTFEATSSEFASIAGQRSAHDRAMQEISADIRRQIAAYFHRIRRAPAGEPIVIPP